jgi:hypothetical protein
MTETLTRTGLVPRVIMDKGYLDQHFGRHALHRPVDKFCPVYGCSVTGFTHEKELMDSGLLGGRSLVPDKSPQLKVNHFCNAH